MSLSSHEVMVILSTAAVGGLLVNLVAQALKKIFKLKTASVIHTMVVAVSIVASWAQYSTVIKSKLPPEILGISGVTIYGWSQVLFKYAGYAQGFLIRLAASVTAKQAAQASDAAVAAVIVPNDPTLAPDAQKPDTSPAEFSA